MPKIIDPDLLVVGTELTLDTTAKTFTLNVAGNLSNDGVSLQALYSKFKELWLTPTYQPFPFPIYCIDAEAGKFQFGTDGANFSGWAPANDATRNLLRDGGWEEYAANGALNRIYVGITTLGSVGVSDQLYYQRAQAGVSRNFVFTGPANEGVQVFGNLANGDFDERSFFKVFARIQGKTYSQSDLPAIGETQTGPRKLAFAIQNAADLNIETLDATIASTLPYTGITVTYYAVDQNKTIGGGTYPFDVVINGNGATAEQIYEKVQYLLRQDADIDNGTGEVIGKTANALLSFVGSTLVTSTGVFIENFDANDTNRIEFFDTSGVKRTFPFVAAGTLAFNTNLVADTVAVYRMFFKTLPGAGNDYGESGAITVNDASGDPIAGTISGRGELAFDFAYDSNVQGGRTTGTDAAVVVISIGKNSGKFVSTEYTITRSTGQRVALVAEKERSYTNP